MYYIEGTKIVLTRGDTFICDVSIKQGSDDYIPAEGDRVRFALKRKMFAPDKGNYIDQNPLILVEIPTETLVLELHPEDTKKLKFGTYAYDVEITFVDKRVDTFISGDLVLMPEVE